MMKRVDACENLRKMTQEDYEKLSYHVPKKWIRQREAVVKYVIELFKKREIYKSNKINRRWSI